MPSSPAHDYAEQIRALLPRCLQELREAARLSKYALEQVSGISRQMIGRVESGAANPSFCLMAQLCRGMGLSLAEFTALIEAGAATPPDAPRADGPRGPAPNGANGANGANGHGAAEGRRDSSTMIH